MSVLRARLADVARSEKPRRELAPFGELFAVFEEQDSGCLSYGVVVEGARWFIKLAPTGPTAALLRSAARFRHAV